jgi:hypothetical protein
MVTTVSEQDLDLGSSEPADKSARGPDLDMGVVSAELIGGLRHGIER